LGSFFFAPSSLPRARFNFLDIHSTVTFTCFSPAFPALYIVLFYLLSSLPGSSFIFLIVTFFFCLPIFPLHNTFHNLFSHGRCLVRILSGMSVLLVDSSWPMFSSHIFQQEMFYYLLPRGRCLVGIFSVMRFLLFVASSPKFNL